MDIPRHSPFTVRVIAATDGDPATMLRLYQDAMLVDAKPPDSEGKADFAFASGLTKGTYVFEGSALNADGESDKVSAALAVLGGRPNKPTSITIVLG